jgi:hypothetical protein
MIALSSKDLRARRRAHQHHERTIDEPAPAAYDKTNEEQPACDMPSPLP